MKKESTAGTLIENSVWGYTVYNIFTKANHYRWWNIYSEIKYWYLAYGKCTYMIEIKWKNVSHNLEQGDTFCIHAWIPNIFYFHEDSLLIESFPHTAKKEKYLAYQTIKKNKISIID